MNTNQKEDAVREEDGGREDSAGTSITIRFEDTERVVTATRVAGGLALHRSQDGWFGEQRGWNVTHIASGLMIGPGRLPYSIARKHMTRLLALAKEFGIDWNLTRDQIREHPDVDAFRERLNAQKRAAGEEAGFTDTPASPEQPEVGRSNA